MSDEKPRPRPAGDAEAVGKTVLATAVTDPVRQRPATDLSELVGRENRQGGPVNDQPGPARLALDFLRLNELLRSGGDVESATQRLVVLAVTSIPSCDWAAVTVWPRKVRPYSVAYSAEVALTADQLQYAVGDGPCLSAAAGDEQPVLIADLDDERRWPRFCAAARSRTPVRSVLSFHLDDEPDAAALNLYSTRPMSFDSEAVSLAALFAAHARVLLLHAKSSDKASQLSQALSTSRQIGAAVGILMNAHKLTADQAFDLLRTASQHLNRKLHLVADDVTRSGTLPPG